MSQQLYEELEPGLEEIAMLEKARQRFEQIVGDFCNHSSWLQKGNEADSLYKSLCSTLGHESAAGVIIASAHEAGTPIYHLSYATKGLDCAGELTDPIVSGFILVPITDGNVDKAMDEGNARRDDEANLLLSLDDVYAAIKKDGHKEVVLYH